MLKTILSFTGCFAAALILLVAGCSHEPFSLRPVLGTNSIPATLSTNWANATNTVVVPEVRDDTGAVVVPGRVIEEITPIQTIVTNPPRVVIVTNAWEKDPRFYGTVEAVGSAIPGWGQLATGAIGALGTILAAWQTRRQQKANKQAVDNEAALVGTIQGIEQIRLALQNSPKGRELDAKVVELLKKAQAEHGAIDVVQKLVELHTGYTRQQIDLGAILEEPKKGS